MKCSTQGIGDFCLILTATKEGLPKLHQMGLLIHMDYGLHKTGT